MSTEPVEKEELHRLDRFLKDSVQVVNRASLPKMNTSSQVQPAKASSKLAAAPSSTRMNHTSNNITKTSPEYLAIQQRMTLSTQCQASSVNQIDPHPSASNAKPPQPNAPINKRYPGGTKPAPGPRPGPPAAASKGMGRLPPSNLPLKKFLSPPSEAGTNTDWWARRNKGPSSLYSYPETAITDRNDVESVCGSEMQQYLDRLESLEAQVSQERARKLKFQEDLKKLSPATFAALQPIFNLRETINGLKDDASIATSGVL